MGSQRVVHDWETKQQWTLRVVSPCLLGKTCSGWFSWSPNITPLLTLVTPNPFLSISCMFAKSLKSCPTLCDPVDCSPPGSSYVHGILQARILEWVARPFSPLYLTQLQSTARLDVPHQAYFQVLSDGCLQTPHTYIVIHHLELRAIGGLSSLPNYSS